MFVYAENDADKSRVLINMDCVVRVMGGGPAHGFEVRVVGAGSGPGVTGE